MKPFFLLLLAGLSAFALQAQNFKKLPAFGDVSKEELQMTECSFDKGAAAMIIFNEAESVLRLNLNSPALPYRETEQRIRIKIFNQSGFEHANIRIRYPTWNKTFAVSKLSAQTYNLDATGNIVVTKLDKATVYDKKIDTRYAEKIFAFPDVKPGCVLEYKYTLENTSIGNWYFQKEIPVQFSRFILDFSPELVISAIPNCTMPLLSNSTTKKGAGNYSWYAMENIPGLAYEPYMSCPEDYRQRMEAYIIALDFPDRPRQSLLQTWQEIIKELMDDEDFGKQLKKEIPRTAELDKMLLGVSDPYKKMVIIHDYVRSNMEWNGYADIWALDGVKNAWRDKKGTGGEINLILINLLKDAGLTAHPLLASTRSNGSINTGMAGYDQFDKVLAQVTIGKKIYTLDATEKATPSSLIPLEVMASEGLLIAKPDSYEWGWRTIWDDTHMFNRNVMLNAEVDAEGNLQGYAKITASDYERCKLMPEGRKSMGSLKDQLASTASLRIDSVGFENAETDSLPLIEHIKFMSTGNSTGEYKYFGLNLFTGLEKNPFVAEERTSDIFYGANQKYNISATIFIPEGYTMDALPKSLRMRMPDTSILFTRQASFSSGILNVNYQLEFRTPFFGSDVYPDFREFYKKLFDLLNEKFVFKKS
jgi:hypothetical protein